MYKSLPPTKKEPYVSCFAKIRKINSPHLINLTLIALASVRLNA
jgi:hypothetical protein